MRQRNDQVFSVSLAEIAFILVFILMVLLGFMLVHERAQRERLQLDLERQGKALEAVAVAKAMNDARRQLEQAAQRGGIPNPQAFADQLAAAGRREAENAQLQQELIDMNKRMEALESMRQAIESAAKQSAKDPGEITRERVEQALQIVAAIDAMSAGVSKETADTKKGEQKNEGAPVGSPPLRRDTASDLAHVRNALDTTLAIRDGAKSDLQREIRPGDEPRFARDLVATAKQAASQPDKAREMKLQEDNARLNQQIAYYRNQMRGLDHPPCWANKGSAEIIFRIRTTSAGIIITQGWLQQRDADALATPGLETIRQHFGEPVTLSRFRTLAQPFLEFGKRQTPECRHVVSLASSIENADERDHARRTVEGFFYKQESPLLRAQQ
jgi:hypothetical protein